MAKARSPQYPAIGLKEAIEKVKNVYDQDYQKAISREVVAAHMGYNGLNGKSLGVLSAVIKYGLLEGRGDQTRVTDLAVRIIAHPSGSPERIEAIKEAAGLPGLFAELDSKYPVGGSDTAIRAFLLTDGFIPSAADTAIRSYRETKNLVNEESKGYIAPQDTETGATNMQIIETTKPNQALPAAVISTASMITPPIDGERRAVFALAEGDVTITFPEKLSTDSVADLADYIEIFLKKAKREAVPTDN